MEKPTTTTKPVESFDVTIENLEDFLPMMFHHLAQLPTMVSNKTLPVCIVLILPETNTSLYFEWDTFENFIGALTVVDLTKTLKDYAEHFSYFSELCDTFILSTFYKISRPTINFITFNVKLVPPKKEKVMN